MKEVFTEVIRQTLPAIGGFVVGLVAGVAIMWWIFL